METETKQREKNDSNSFILTDISMAQLFLMSEYTTHPYAAAYHVMQLRQC